MLIAPNKAWAVSSGMRLCREPEKMPAEIMRMSQPTSMSVVEEEACVQDGEGDPMMAEQRRDEAEQYHAEQQSERPH